MSYATQAEILTEFKDFTPSLTTPISTTDIDAYIEEAEAEINCRLAAKYEVPITGTQALIMMKMIEKWLVKHRIEQILQVKTGRDADTQTGTKSYRDQALGMLDDLVKGKIVLTDATLASSHDGIKSYTADNDSPYVFDKDTNQW